MANEPHDKTPDIAFVNEMRLEARHWLAVIAIVVPMLALTPWLWKKVERFKTGPDYRIPYALSSDYFLYQRRLQSVAESNICVLGDSVVWGEYVRPEGTLTHFLNQQSGVSGRFVNGGVNGLFPLAMEGLVRSYGRALRREKIILHCNLLWMTSPKADLSATKEEQFNHARLVPQFTVPLRCYRADFNERLNALAERNVPFFGWVSHLQDAYFAQKSIPKWTLEDEGDDGAKASNSYRNPLSQITMVVPAEPEMDPQRGPQSPRHRSWSTNATGTTVFEWVPLEKSLQWQAFQRTVSLLRDRQDDVFVVVGPFNEHLMAPANRPVYHLIRDQIGAWLTQRQISHVLPDTLPSLLYADASHPLTAGYEQMAAKLYGNSEFQTWLKRSRSPSR
ncbi:MAG: hypothetical protein QOF48_216 [Verrucomicrobiota bacterium]